MKCPICGSWTFVKQTVIREDNTRKRRYECANEHRFGTVETIVCAKQKPAKSGAKPTVSALRD
jgi:transcriptional regulator NrdR family protein